MSRSKSISVALAAYNGMRFIDEQINSILLQLENEDELIISCDPSSDGTWDHINALYKDDRRIKILQGMGKGVVKNFENALYHCKNDYIFLCDQDDNWMPNKVQVMLDAFDSSGAMLILHDARIVNAELKITKPSFFKSRHCRKGFYYNIMKNSYIGCCMAFKRELLDFSLPFPEGIPMHDQWLGLVAEKKNAVYLLREPLILYRRHDKNVSSIRHANLFRMIKWRINLLREFMRR